MIIEKRRRRKAADADKTYFLSSGKFVNKNV